MLGPEANHHILVSHAENFRWRDGHMGDLIPLLGDGLLTIDGDFHRRSRKAMLPGVPPRADRRVDARRSSTRRPRAVDALPAGGELDLYTWTRRLALRIAMRALFGFDPDRSTRGVDVAHAFEDGPRLLRARLLPAGPARAGHAVLADAARARRSSTA